MKRLWLAAVAVLCLTACNSELGPEDTTPPTLGELTYYPAEITPKTVVTASIPVSCPYGFSYICIYYWVGEDVSKVEATAWRTLTEEITSLTYEGKLPRMKAGTKVSFQVCAVSSHNVPAITPVKTYTVGDDEPAVEDDPENHQ